MDVTIYDSPEAYEAEYNSVRAAFVARGTTLHAWLGQHGICRQTAYKALKGKSFGRRSIQLRATILKEAFRKAA